MRKTYVDQLGEIRYRSGKEEIGFAQMWHVLTLDCELSDAAFRLYALILKYARQKDNAYMSVGTLAEGLCKSPSSIRRALKELVDKGLISREEIVGQTSTTWIEEIDVVYRGRIEELIEKKTRTPPKNDTPPLPKMTP